MNAVAPQGRNDDAVRAATGRVYGEWFALLDEAGAEGMSHTEIARWLVSEHGVDGWWSQGVTVAYEQARGRRLPGQQSDGTFAVSVSRTVRAPRAAVLQAVEERVTREHGTPTGSSPDAKFATVRWRTADWALEASASDDKGRTRVVLTRSKMADGTELGDAKATLRRLLDEAVLTLEGE